jgi:hypothetical protein
MPQKVTKSKKKTIRERKQRAEKLSSALAYVRHQEQKVEDEEYVSKKAADEDLFVVDKPKIVSIGKLNQTLIKERRAEKLKKFKDGLTKEIGVLKEKAITRPIAKQNSEFPKEDKDAKRTIREMTIRTRAELKADKPMKDEPNKAAILDFWQGKAKKTTSKKDLKPTVPLPHAGQSYNPDKEAHKQTLNIAFKGEKKLIDKLESIENSMKRRLEEETGGGGDDVIDGLRIDMRPTERQPAEDVQYPPSFVPKKKKLTKTKLKNLKKHLRELKVKRERETRHDIDPEKIMAKVDDRLKRREDERGVRKQRKEQKQKNKQLSLVQPVHSAKDVLLEEELPSRLGVLDGNSFYLWQERLRNYHNSKMVVIPSLK